MKLSERIWLQEHDPDCGRECDCGIQEMVDRAEALEAVAEAAQDVTKHTKLIGRGITETRFAAMQELVDALDRLQELEDGKTN